MSGRLLSMEGVTYECVDSKDIHSWQVFVCKVPETASVKRLVAIIDSAEWGRSSFYFVPERSKTLAEVVEQLFKKVEAFQLEQAVEQLSVLRSRSLHVQ